MRQLTASLLALLVFLPAASVRAQTSSGEQTSPVEEDGRAASRDSFHVELVSGRTLRGTVEQEDPLFRSSYLVLGDSARYELSEVRSFSTEDGHFRRVPGRGDKFAHRTSQGPRIERFAAHGRTMMTAAVPAGGTYGTTYGPPSSILVGGGEYFSKEGGPLQPITYGTLKDALAENPQSMAHLRTHRTISLVSWGTIGVGLGTAAIGVAGMESDGGVPTLAIVGAGLAAVGGWVPQLFLDGLLDRALDAYDR